MSIIFTYAIIPLATLLVWAQLSWATDSRPSYEIPLSDLKRVEKKPAKKPETHVHKEKAETKVRKEKKKHRRQERDVSYAESDNPPSTPAPAMSGTVRITHDPYSYVVPGKRIIIKAVIGSQGELTSIRCQFRSSKGAGYASVPMTREEGSQFTYSATLPALANGTQNLRYSIVVVDAAAKVTRSREFVIPVNSTAVTPGWQEPPKDPIAVTPETPGQSVEGFSDTIVTAPAGK